MRDRAVTPWLPVPIVIGEEGRVERGELEIRLLGKLEVLREETPLSLPRFRKTRALLAYPVATRRVHPRFQLCDLLWEESADPRAAFRWSLSDANERQRLQKVLTESLVGSSHVQASLKDATLE